MCHVSEWIEENAENMSDHQRIEDHSSDQSELASVVFPPTKSHFKINGRSPTSKHKIRAPILFRLIQFRKRRCHLFALEVTQSPCYHIVSMMPLCSRRGSEIWTRKILSIAQNTPEIGGSAIALLRSDGIQENVVSRRETLAGF